MSNDEKKGRLWPIAIVLSIVAVVLLCVYTVMVAISKPVEPSDRFMQDYHSADNNINDIIANRIAFDKHYSLTILPMQLKKGENIVNFEIKEKSNGKPVGNATLSLKLTRPDSTKSDVVPKSINYVDGIYKATIDDLPLEGRWDIMVKVNIGKFQRYYEYKADTRYPQIHPSGE